MQKEYQIQSENAGSVEGHRNCMTMIPFGLKPSISNFGITVIVRTIDQEPHNVFLDIVDEDLEIVRIERGSMRKAPSIVHPTIRNFARIPRPVTD